jgi:hypothetical protein
MLHYPKIPDSRNAPNQVCIAFEKYDGTNLHWEWDRDFGWHAFGTRRDQYNLTPAGIAQFEQKHAHLSGCTELFNELIADQLDQILRQNPAYQAYQSCKAFTEYFGENSFAGLHRETDPKELRLFDLLFEPDGMLGPEQFVRDFAELPIARVVYRGRLTGQFVEDVRRGKYGVNEGVICKSGSGGKLWMAKIKTNAYMQRLQQAFAANWEDYWE